MKVTRLFLLPLAVAGFMCLPVISALAATPQEQNPNNAQEHRGERQQQANPGRGNHNAQEHRNMQSQQRMHGNQTTAHNRGNQQLPAYNFGPRDQQQLRQGFNRSHFRHQVNPRNRSHIARGGYLPRGWRTRMHPVPPQYVGMIPEPPPGYLVGYFDGYAVIYNPNTGLILQFINVY